MMIKTILIKTMKSVAKGLLLLGKGVLCFLLFICLGILFMNEEVEAVLISFFLLILYLVVKKVVQSTGISLCVRSGLLILFFGIFAFVMKDHSMSDEDLCADTGVCKETIMSKEECLLGGGKWAVLDDIAYCYLKWSMYSPVTNEQ